MDFFETCLGQQPPCSKLWLPMWCLPSMFWAGKVCIRVLVGGAGCDGLVVFSAGLAMYSGN